jgi:Kef-type K+ transport system membrane component KefB/nucleotide-binding universal stress UspA family protein
MSFPSWPRSGPSSQPSALPTGLRVAAAIALCLVPAAAWAATGGKGPSEPLFVAQILILVVAGRLMGEAMERVGQPAVMGQLIAGILLGPSFLGLFWADAQHALFPSTPEQKSMIDAVGQLGVLLLLLLAGMETDLALVNKVRRAALSVSLSGVALPFACGFLLGEFLPDSMVADPGKRIVTSLFLGTALSISSVKIVAIIVRQMNFGRRDVGQIILASAIIDDTIGWIIIAVTFGVAATGSLALLPLLKSIVGAVLFMAFSLTVGRRLVTLAIRLTNDHFVGELPVVSMVLVIMGVMALITDALGLHTVLGAFVAGVLVGESPILTRQIEEQLRGLTTALFMPVFFGLSGLSTDLRVLADPHLLGVSLGLIAIASIGKFSGAFIGGKLGGLGTRECLALGCGMNARGSTEVVVASIGLSMGALSQTLFTMIVAMAVVTTMLMPPSLRWALRRLPMRQEEAERLAREEFEQQGFVTRLERLLVLSEETPGGRFVGRLAGLLAGPMGVPVTTLVASKAGDSSGADAPAAPAEGVLQAAEQGRETMGEGEPPRPVDVVARTIQGERDAVVAAEALRGYDILLASLGEDASLTDKDLVRTITAFGGPMALAAVRGVHRQNPAHGPSRILVPVNGSIASRRGLEVGLALARATRADITALHVREPGRRPRRFGLGRRVDLAVLREAVSLAEQMDVKLRTRVHRRAGPADATVAEARRGYDLIVLGVAKRPGEVPVAGKVAETLLEEATVSVVLVAT